MQSVGLGMLGDPITPLVQGITSLSSRWAGVIPLAAMDFIGEYAMDMAPSNGTTFGKITSKSIDNLYFMAKMETWNRVAAQHPSRV